MKNKLIEKIRRLISLNEVEEAINSLDLWLSNMFFNPYRFANENHTTLLKFLNDVKVLSARFKDLKSREIKGIISQEEANVERAKINGSLKIIVECLNLGKTVNYGKRLRRFVKTT